MQRTFLERLRSDGATARPILLDGAMGTELERRGSPCTLPLWSAEALIERPDRVAEVHADYVAAGCDALTANTFRTQRRSLEHAGLGERAAELTRRAVELAREAAQRCERPIAVLGSAPPLEDCFRPERVPEPPALEREHAEHAEQLAAAGVDAVLVETMSTAREARAAARGARAAGLPALVCFRCDAAGRLLSGEPLARALAELRREEPIALGVNCLPLSAVEPCLALLQDLELPFLVYPNLGSPAEGGVWSEDLSPAGFAERALSWLSAGARAVGGCCGTRPEHLAALAARL